MLRSVALLQRNAGRTAILSFAVFFAAACGGGTVADRTAAISASSVPSFGAASTFAVLGGPAVTCTDSSIIGDVGAGFPLAPVTRTNCVITGIVHEGDAAAIAAYADFLKTYDAFQALPCDQTLTGTLAGVTLTPGVYCFDAAATLTGLLTLNGPTNGVWIFKIGTLGTGALTGTNFSMVMADGSVPACNSVYWWVAQAATLTDSTFIGTILAGDAITITRGTFSGDAYARAAVTLTGDALTGCPGVGGRGGGGGHPKDHCNQGVGNGPEDCDPGNSNHHNPSNDENGGTPGDPGRKR